MLIIFFGKSVLFDLIKPATSLLLFADNGFEAITYKRTLLKDAEFSKKKIKRQN